MTSMLSNLRDAGSTIVLLLAAMAIVGLVETFVPLQARSERGRFAPNLILTSITFVTNAVLGSALIVLLTWLQAKRFGLLPAVGLPSLAESAVAVIGLDLSFYVAHVAMHKIRGLWRFHRIHHSDPAVDVTTTLRQHPGEGLIRYGFVTLFAVGLGASPAAFAIYRSLSAFTALLEHANIRVPAWLDRLLSLVTTWPNMHKLHHSRQAIETDSNYGNVLSLWDRLFRTFTPASHRTSFAYGLDDTDARPPSSTLELLASPFRGSERGQT